MKKGVLVVFLILFSLADSVSANVIEDEINSIVHYAELFELGKINYLQLIVYGNTISEEINSKLGHEYELEGEETRRGLSEEDAKKLFGQPTEMTNWVWVINEEHDEQIEEKLPKWEKRLFDGRRIIITFNAWPVIIKGNEIIKFYEVNFNIKFKTHFDFDINDMLRDIKHKAQQYLEMRQNGEDLVKKIAEYEGFLQAYLEQNNDDCKNIMGNFFDSEDKREQQKKVRYSVDAYNGKNLLLKIIAEACEDCEWPHINMWFDIKVEGGGFEPNDEEVQKLQHDVSKSFDKRSIEELNRELEDTIEELVSWAKESDKARRFKNPEKLGYFKTTLDRINRFLDEAHYDDRWNREENYEKRIAVLKDLLSKYGDVETEAFTEIRYENRLAEKLEATSHKFCRDIGIFQCNPDEGCLDGECIKAKGGFEDCKNKADDDGDGIIDCPDPDCAVECGWACKDVCEEECWQCEQEECRAECAKCWGCEGDCEGLCKDTCWKCTEEKCRQQPVCKECRTCEKNAWDEYEKEKCNKICNGCEDCEECERCQNNLRYRECRNVCEDSCWKCNQEFCSDDCESCHKCNERGGNCEDACQSCWECEMDNCQEKEICGECKECEQRVSREIEKERCDKRCNKCDKTGSSEECKGCKDCRAEEKRHLCDDVCKDECWPCEKEKCNNQCKDCWKCDHENEDCQSRCEGCWECTQDKCYSQDFCTSCNECQQRIWQEEHPCALPCDMCKGCTERWDEDEEYCIKACNECFDCETPDNVKKCMSVCDIIIVDEEEKPERERCYKMCEQEVIFYCEGEPQNTPCLHTKYLCPDRLKKIPCDTFKCEQSDGKIVKQTVPCGQEEMCGEGRFWKDRQCICVEGWYDCDINPRNGCESDKPCEGVKEFCNDAQDNDFDGLIDCQDLSDCGNKFCDLISEHVCKDGECVIKCPDNFIFTENDGCVPIEVCMIGYERDENGNCIRIGEEPQLNATTNVTVNVTVPVNITLPINISEENVTIPVNITTNVTEEIPIQNATEEVSEPIFSNDTSIVINDTELINESEEPICVDGDESKTMCPSGEEIVIAICSDGLWVGLNIECPPAEDKEDIQCPNGYYFKDNKCLFIEKEEEVCLPWQVLSDKGVCEDISEEEKEKPEDEEEGTEEELEIIETDKRCAVREDCDDENAICSKGICKLLPKEIIENEETIIVEKVDIELPEIPEEIEEEQKEVKADEEAKEEEIKEKEQQEDDETKEKAYREEDKKVENERLEEEDEVEKEEFMPTGNVILDLKSEKTVVDILTGWVIKEKECKEHKDCGENRMCDIPRGKCHCMEYFFDCNGNGEGNDGDGCESKDPTCGGKWEACRHPCMPNQVCIEELGRCECKEGFYECDGDWENGCEATKKCEECNSDDDCAKSRCTERDNSVVKFACVEDNPHMEEKAVISFSGGCFIKATGKTETHLHFDVWGEDLEELNQLRHKFEGKSGWCKREIEGLKKQRKELENALNEKFLKWFFEEYVASSPAEWKKHISGIFASYWRFADNARELHEMSKCLENSELDIDLQEIEYKSEYGELHYWEKMEKLEGMDIITPIMQIWVFPPKDFIKEEFKKAMEEGRIPGPDDEQKGPSPKEIEEMKKDPENMKKINELSDKYGGSADFLVEVHDEDETIYKVLMSINPNEIVKLIVINKDSSYNEKPDVSVLVDFDFLYDMIQTFEKEAHIESPPWAREPRSPMKEVVNKGKIFFKISAAIISGDIKVKPITEIPTVLNLLKVIAGGSM